MTSEQQPENKGGRPPPGTVESWLLEEGEMSREEVRSLGHLLYAGIFTGVSQPVYAGLRKEHNQHVKQEPNDDPEPYNVKALSAELYIEKYAQVYGLNSNVLKRWAQQASIELAHATIPVLLDERERLAREEWWSQDQIEEYTHDIIEPVIEVSEKGISSSVEYHSHLVGEAYYMDRYLDNRVPLNSSLIRSIFDNRTN